jgi:hypothetical protein
MQNLHQSTWDHVILYTDRSSKDETFNKTIFVKNKKYEHGGRLNVKIYSLFCGDNSWTVALRQMNFGIVKNLGHTYKFCLNHYFVWRSFKNGDGAKFWGYVGINAEQLCVEFCNFNFRRKWMKYKIQ